MGAWIETLKSWLDTSALKSHPTWVRGLKHDVLASDWQTFVAPYVGAWIETSTARLASLSALVAPYVGAWIET